MERDFEANPYTPHEMRVAEYIVDNLGIGAGDDPVEFLIASHRALIAQISLMNSYIKMLEAEEQ